MKPPDEKLMRAHWESRVEKYTLDRKWSPVDEEVLDLLQLKAGQRLLEIGFGPALIAAEIKRRYPEAMYYGLDPAIGFINIARDKLGDTPFLLQASASHLPFKKVSFDYILEMAAIHHFPPEYIPCVVEEIAGFLKPEGCFIAVEDWGTPPENERERLTLSLRKRQSLASKGLEYHPGDDEWVEMFEKAGLRVEDMKHIERPPDLQRFDALKDPEAAIELKRLRRLQGNEPPTFTMSIFVCRKA